MTKLWVFLGGLGFGLWAALFAFSVRMEAHVAIQALLTVIPYICGHIACLIAYNKGEDSGIFIAKAYYTARAKGTPLPVYDYRLHDHKK